MPGHCTGWRAFAEIATRFPERYLAWSVGTRLVFEAPAALGSIEEVAPVLELLDRS